MEITLSNVASQLKMSETEIIDYLDKKGIYIENANQPLSDKTLVKIETIFNRKFNNRNSSFSETNSANKKARNIKTFMKVFAILAVVLITFIIITLNLKTVSVPNVIGLTQSEAIHILNKYNLKASVKDEYNNTTIKGSVISQNVKSGEKVRLHTNIEIFISKGIEQTVVPKFINLSKNEMEKLSKLKKLIVVYKEEYSEKLIGNAISQEPIEGTSVKINTEISIVISKGIKKALVPNVINKTKSEAESAISALKLKAEIIEDYSDSVPNGKVISQTPSPDANVEINTVVKIVVSIGKEKKQSSSTVITPNTNTIADTTTTSTTKKAYYKWTYSKYSWTYSLEIPITVYNAYKSIDRNIMGSDYRTYIISPYDDEYMAKLSSVFVKSSEEEGFSKWETVGLIVSFVQSLKYVSDKISTGFDEYPKFPIETLADQGGDCEDSSILLASLLRELNYGVVLIQFDGHMGVGIKGADGIPGSYFEYLGNRYYYIETTDSGWEVGEMPEELKNKKAVILPL